MYQCVGLNNKNLEFLKKLNKSKDNFNKLNQDFFEVYDKYNFAGQMILKRKVKLLKKDLEYIGYIWSDMVDKNNCSINALSVDLKNLNIPNYLPYKFLVDALRKNCNISYLCQHNCYNVDILRSIGFTKNNGTFLLASNIGKNMPLIIKDGLTFEILKTGIDEKKRCDIQNKVFKDENRTPLTLQDIYFDEAQSYYFERGAVFLKKGERYIGYGQIIIEHNVPLIVNFGILKEYRGNGYSKSLLIYLLKIIKYNGFNEVKIKVKSSNTIALNLYKTLGFEVVEERYKWEIKK